MSIPFAVLRIPVIFSVAMGFALWGSHGFATGARRSAFQERGSAESTGKPSSIADAPLSFEANLGQTWQEARFLARGFGYNLFFATDGVLIRLGSKASGSSGMTGKTAAESAGDRKQQTSIRMGFSGAAASVSGIDRRPGRISYLLGGRNQRRLRDVPHFRKIRYESLWPGIDMVWYGIRKQFEYDLVVSPGADPKAIALNFDGARSMSIDHEGGLVLETPDGRLRFDRPFAYQVIDGQKSPVRASYVTTKEGRVSFEIGSYDRGEELVIDPTLTWSSYFGGSGTGFGNNSGIDECFDMAVDANGDMILTGYTESVNFPLERPVQDAIRSFNGCCADVFVTKLSSSGIVYSTYLGGAGVDLGFSVALDPHGNAVITGSTTSTDFPITSGVFQPAHGSNRSAFIAKFDPWGGLLFSTYLSGTAPTSGYSVASDGDGFIYVTGLTRANDFPLAKPLQATFGGGFCDAFVSKIDPSGTALIYSTYLGGDGADVANGIAVDGEGAVYLTGSTDSFAFPVTNPVQDYWVEDYNLDGAPLPDAFITKLSPDGSRLEYSTYLGNYEVDFGTDITVDEAGRAHLTGYSYQGLAGNTDFPPGPISQARQMLRRQPGVGSAFVLRMNRSGTAPEFIFYLGGRSLSEIGNGISIDKDGLIYIAGATGDSSALYPFSVTPDAFQAVIPVFGGADAFLAILDPSRQNALKYSTLIGGRGVDYGSAVGLDRQRNIYVAGSTYHQPQNGPNDFPVVSPPYQQEYGPAGDAFIARFAPGINNSDDSIAPVVSITGPSASGQFTTNQPRIAISGTATDNSGIKAVTYTHAHTIGQPARGISEWRTPDLLLQRGLNVITVMASDLSGNLGAASITINYEPEYVIQTVAGQPEACCRQRYYGDGGPAALSILGYPSSLAFDKAGNLYFVDYDNARVRKISPSGTITNFAGNGQARFSGDGGPATEAGLQGAGGLATDDHGNVYICDPWARRVRKVTPEGIIYTIAGSGPTWPGTPEYGGDGGPATRARFKFPSSVVVDQTGNIFIADSEAQRIRRIDVSGIVTTIAGNGDRGNAGDGGPALGASIEEPSGLAFDKNGNLCFTSSRIYIRCITPDGRIMRIAGAGSSGSGAEGVPALEASLLNVLNIAFDRRGILHFAGERIGRINAAGLVETVAGAVNDGHAGEGIAATSAALATPIGIAINEKGHIYFSEPIGRRIRRLIPVDPADNSAPELRLTSSNSTAFTSLTPLIAIEGLATDDNGVVLIRWQNDRGGSGEAFGSEIWRITNIPLEPGLNNITITGYDAAGNAGSITATVTYQPDTSPPIVRITRPTTTDVYEATGVILKLYGFSSDDVGVREIAWRSTRGYSGYAFGEAASWRTDNILLREGVNRLMVTATDFSGNVGSTILTVNYKPEYLIRTTAGGNFSIGPGNDDVIPAIRAGIFMPTAIAVDAPGNVYYSDDISYKIRRITPEGMISTYAGGGESEVTDGADARSVFFRRTEGLAFDASGNLYVAETQSHRLVRITPDGKVYILAGDTQFGYGGDGGPARNARLFGPSNLVLDAAGNIYFSDTGNQRIRRITAGTGTIETIAGNGTAGYGGDGGPATAATLNGPRGMDFDRHGNLYFADSANNLIRRIGTDGMIRTIAGIPGLGGTFSGDDGPAIAALFSLPVDVKTDAAGNILIVDLGNYCIRRIRPNGVISTIAGLNPLIGYQYGLYRGDGVAATWAMLGEIVGMALDGLGRIHLLDRTSQRIRTLLPYAINNQPVTSVSAASYASGAVAAESIATAFGSRLAPGTYAASSTPLPTQIGSTDVKVTDSTGAERSAPLFFVSPGQINYLIPRGTAMGRSTVTVSSGDGAVSHGVIDIARVSPSLFSADASGSGMAAAVVLRVRPDGTQVFEPVAEFDSGKVVPRPIDLGAASDQVFLVLFGTGLRNRSGLDKVRVTIGGELIESIYAGPQGALVGLDQINLKLPSSLSGRGEVAIEMYVDDIKANTVRVSFR